MSDSTNHVSSVQRTEGVNAFFIVAGLVLGLAVAMQLRTLVAGSMLGVVPLLLNAAALVVGARLLRRPTVGLASGLLKAWPVALVVFSVCGPPAIVFAILVVGARVAFDVMEMVVVSGLPVMVLHAYFAYAFAHHYPAIWRVGQVGQPAPLFQVALAGGRVVSSRAPGGGTLFILDETGGERLDPSDPAWSQVVARGLEVIYIRESWTDSMVAKVGRLPGSVQRAVDVGGQVRRAWRTHIGHRLLGFVAGHAWLAPPTPTGPSALWVDGQGRVVEALHGREVGGELAVRMAG